MRLTLSLRNIDYLQALGSGVVHGIRCAAGLLGEVADAQTAIIDQVAVSLVHTAAIIVFGSINDLVRGGLYPFVIINVRLNPSPCLILAWENQDQFNIRVLASQLKDGLCSQCVKAQSAASAEIPIALFYGLNQHMPRLLFDLSLLQKGYCSMTCEAGRPFFYLDHLIFSGGNIV